VSNNTGSGRLSGLWPAVVKSYDGPGRTCIVDIPGITDGADAGLVAEIKYPIGDKSAHATMTEIEILAGDKVWVEFIQGDPRYPIITGWRNPRSGNDTGSRRFHHGNMEMAADSGMKMSGDSVDVSADSALAMSGGSVTITSTGGAPAVLNGDLTVNGNIIASGDISAGKNVTAGENVSAGGSCC